MANNTHILSRKVDGREIYRRDVVKADGRDLLLYGYAPHTQAPLPEEGGEVAKGGELRWHPLRQEWNLYAPHRQNRTFKPSAADDPLAPSKPNGPPTEIPFTDFELAIFENKFTSLHAEAPLPASVAGLDMKQAKGRCDVVVYGPEATGNLHAIGQDKRRLLLSAWIDRYEALFAQGHKFVMPFENRGDEVGVTLHHPHGQIYAFPIIPDVQKKTADAFAQGYDLARELKTYEADYHVAAGDEMLAFCPPYARFPYEVWIAPRKRMAGPWEFSDTAQDEFAHLLGEVTRKYDAFFERPTAYMLSLHAAPLGTEDHFNFTAKFYPLLRAPGRVKYLASVEQATGVFTVDVMPEMAAKTLRSL
ncbi:MAG: galactose-1-phosphate uridylyltransferase [Maricaulaceae bacterium]